MLTQRQAECLGFLERWFSDHREAPGYREIAAGLGIVSLGAVHRLIVSLEERGYVQRLPGKKRAIRLLKEQPDVTAERERVLQAVESHLLAVSSVGFTEITLACVRRALTERAAG